MSALTLYHTTVHASTIGTAHVLATATGGSQTNGTWGTRPSSATTCTELRASTGNNGTTSLPTVPSSNGFLLDDTSLEGKTLLAGDWTLTLSVAHSSSAWTGHLAINIWKRDSGGNYSLIASNDNASNAATTVTYTARSCTATQASDVAFATGDKLYIECYFHCSVRPASGATLLWYISSTSSGVATATITTPGYEATETRTVASVSAATIQAGIAREVTTLTAATLATEEAGVASVTAVLAETHDRTASSVTAALSSGGTYSRTVTPVTAAMLATLGRGVTPVTTHLQKLGVERGVQAITVATQATETATVTPITAVVQQTLSRGLTPLTVTLRATLAHTLTPTTAILATTTSRPVASLGATLKAVGLPRTVASLTATLSGGTARALSNLTAALLGTHARTVASLTASVMATLTRVLASVTAATLATRTRVVPLTVVAGSGSDHFVNSVSAALAAFGVNRSVGSCSTSLADPNLPPPPDGEGARLSAPVVLTDLGASARTVHPTAAGTDAARPTGHLLSPRES